MNILLDLWLIKAFKNPHKVAFIFGIDLPRSSNEISNNNVPLKTLSVEEKKRSKPWITPCMLVSMKIKNNYCKKFMKTKAKFWYGRYKYYRDKLLHKYFQGLKKNMAKNNELLHHRNKQK